MHIFSNVRDLFICMVLLQQSNVGAQPRIDCVCFTRPCVCLLYMSPLSMGLFHRSLFGCFGVSFLLKPLGNLITKRLHIVPRGSQECFDKQPL